jgi:hypothetical protein
MLGDSEGVNMEIIKEALMQWGEAMHLSMENRSLFYSPVLNHWRVKKWAGKNAKSFLYDGSDFLMAFDFLLGNHTPEHSLRPTGSDETAENQGDKPEFKRKRSSRG